jgi:hypothetical protein
MGMMCFRGAPLTKEEAEIMLRPDFLRNQRGCSPTAEELVEMSKSDEFFVLLTLDQLCKLLPPGTVYTVTGRCYGDSEALSRVDFV